MSRLSPAARAIIDNDGTTVLVSAASTWEIATRARRGGLPGAVDVSVDVMACLHS